MGLSEAKQKKVVHIDDLLAQFGAACDECGSMHNNRACESCCKKLAIIYAHLARCGLCRKEAGQADALTAFFIGRVLNNDLAFLQSVQRIAQQTGQFSPAVLAYMHIDSVREEEG